MGRGDEKWTIHILRKIKKRIRLCFHKKYYECGCTHTWSGNVAVWSLSCVQLFVIPWTAACQASLTFTISQSLPNSCPLSQWYNATILFYIDPFFSYLQSFPSSGSFPKSQLLTSGGQSIVASASVLPINTQGWFPLGLTGLISLQFELIWWDAHWVVGICIIFNFFFAFYLCFVIFWISAIKTTRYL